MNALKSLRLVFVAFVVILVFEGVQSMIRTSPERKLVIPSRATYERKAKAAKKPIERTMQRGRTLSRSESIDYVILHPVNSPSERLRKLQIPSRNDSYERLEKEFRKSSGRTQKNLAPSRFRSLSPEPLFSRLSLSDRGNRRIPYEQELIDARASLQPPAPDSPTEVKIQLKYGNVKIPRETEVDFVYHPVPDTKICSLEEREVASICDACVKVHEKVYKKKKYRALDVPAGKRRPCSDRMALFGITWVDVNVRKCPFSPDLYIAQGNGAGWMFVLIPIKGSEEDLRFAVHLGNFDEVLRPKRTRVVRFLEE